MASVIRIKRSGTSGNPSTLAAGELAYSAADAQSVQGGDRLYIGFGSETNGNAAEHIVIGGEFFTSMLDHAKGTLTADSALVVDSNKKIDELNVDNLTLDGNTISSTDSNGDIVLDPNGTGRTLAKNLFIDDGASVRSIEEFIEDISGGQIQGTADAISVDYNDSSGTTTIDLVETGVTAGSFGSTTQIPTFTVDADGRLTAAGEVSVATNLSVSGDTGSATVDLLSDTLAFTGGTSVTTTVTDGATDTVQIDVADATDSVKGIASFNSSDFTVSSGAVSLATVNSNVGQFGSSADVPVITVDGEGRVTAVSTASIATSFTLSADAGTDDTFNNGETLTVTGGTGITTTVSDNTITVDGDDATTTTKGVASFDSSNFTVSSGAVSAKDITLGTSTLTTGSTTNSLAGLQQLDVDNVRVDGNEISTTDTDGDLSLNPNGTGNVSLNSSRITDLAEPVDPQDAATKSYVDARAAGLDPKESVRVASTTNIDIATGLVDGVAVDGVTVSTGDRVLLKDQTDATENGVYVVVASGAASRAADFDEPEEVTSGIFFFVEEGASGDNRGFVLTSDGGQQAVGTDPLNFVQFSGAGQITAGDGLDKTGDVLSVNTANGIEVSSDNVQLASSVAGDGLTFNSGVLDVGGTADRISVSADSIDIASTYVGQASITTLGTITTGTWQGDIISPEYGGTGVDNGTKTITLGGNLVTSGANDLTLTTTGATNVTLPTTGTLATLDQTETFTNKTINASDIGVANPGTAAFTDLAASGDVTFTSTDNSSSISTGALVVGGGVGIGKQLYVGTNLIGSGAATSNLEGFNIDGGTF